jgi:2-dehydro-3-deoxygalactonokinase
MARAALVAGDWGTSHLRLFLCADDGSLLARADGPGVAQARSACADVLDRLLQPWSREHGDLPVVLCGMVGSTVGWTLAPYVPCPAGIEDLAHGCVALRDERLHIVPGVSCRNRLGAPDVMRGEETQIVGAMQLAADLARGRQLLCLPGTHTKWVLPEDGRVVELLTAPTGELFALLREHSILVGDAATASGADTVTDGAGYQRGLSAAAAEPQADLLHRLFECRSRRLMGELAATDSAAFLSGLLIGNDVAGALKLFASARVPKRVPVIGAPGLGALYARALAAQGREAPMLEGTAAALAGLVRLQQLLPEHSLTHGH